DFLNNSSVATPVFQAGSTTDYVLTVTRENCVDTYYQSVSVTELSLVVPGDTTLCDEGAIVLQAAVSPSDANIIWSDEPSFGSVLNDHPQDTDIEVTPVIPTTY